MLEPKYIHEHLYYTKGKSRMTIAYTAYDPDYLFFSWALCSDKDQFVKSLGRDIAKGRLIELLKLASQEDCEEYGMSGMYLNRDIYGGFISKERLFNLIGLDTTITPKGLFVLTIPDIKLGIITSALINLISIELRIS